MVPGPITGATAPFAVRNLVITNLSVTDSGFTVSFNKPFNPSSVDIYTNKHSGTTAALPDDVLLAKSGTVLSVRGSLIFNATDTSFTFVTSDLISPTGTLTPSNGLLAAGNYTLTLRLNGFSGFQDSLGDLLDGTNSGNAGNFQQRSESQRHRWRWAYRTSLVGHPTPMRSCSAR